LAMQRPDMFSGQIQPVIPTPGHGTLPSGHATESFAMAVVLGKLVPGIAGTVMPEADGTFGGRQGVAVTGPEADHTSVDQLVRQAARIAINRTVAGVHFPIDSIAGAMLGIQIGHYIAALAGSGGTVQGASFNGHSIDPAGPQTDMRTSVYLSRPGFSALHDVPEDGTLVTHTADTVTPTANPLLQALWTRAQGEWPARG
ncbi:MAG: phosphatase PAP2 family protein, partial [Pseudomonadota bacterium]